MTVLGLKKASEGLTSPHFCTLGSPELPCKKSDVARHTSWRDHMKGMWREEGSRTTWEEKGPTVHHSSQAHPCRHPTKAPGM